MHRLTMSCPAQRAGFASSWPRGCSHVCTAPCDVITCRTSTFSMPSQFVLCSAGHPLQPLTAEEISSVASACKALAKQEGWGALRFNVVSLKVSVHTECCYFTHFAKFSEQHLIGRLLSSQCQTSAAYGLRHVQAHANANCMCLLLFAGASKGRLAGI
jgi:Cu2+-containing amine oxidase